MMIVYSVRNFTTGDLLCKRSIVMFINKYIKTALAALSGQTNGGIAYMFPQIILRIIYLIPLMFIWRIVTASGYDAGMSLNQLPLIAPTGSHCSYHKHFGQKRIHICVCQ